MTEKKILVVDDEPIILQMIQLYLNENGYQYDLADSAAKAFELLKTNKYALVISDVMMPKMNGFEMIDRIQNEMKLKMPVLLVSAMNDVMKQKAKNLKTAALIKKPFTERSLMTAVMMLIGSPPSTAPPKPEEIPDEDSIEIDLDFD
jgi:two-component system, OmpR family, response regulator ResD